MTVTRETMLSARGLLRITSPVPRDLWEEVLASDPNALPTQSAAWLDGLCALGRHEDASRLYETMGRRLLVLPMVRRRGLGDRRLAVQSSYSEGWGIGGLLASGGVTREDVATVVGDLAAEPALRTLIRPNPLLAGEWKAADLPGARVLPRLAHVLDLGGGFDNVWTRRFSSSARANVRKAEKAGVILERGSSRGLVDAYYELFERSLERWAARQHEPLWLARRRGRRRDSAEKFQALAGSLGDGFGVWLARLNDRPIAAAIVLRGANAHYTRGVMDAERAGRTRANYLLHHHAIREACEAGCQYYHFGETGRSSSLAFFKTRFGAEAHAYAEYRFERLPLTALDRLVRDGVKRLVGFSEPE
jgi:Acetyltransferase (GNAT) domain